MSRWEAFVRQAIEGEVDDPFVAMLRRNIASGNRILRIELDTRDGSPTYRILLERLRQLSELRVPHTVSFTRWSLGAGARMATVEDEARRFALVARDRFESIVEDLGSDGADAVLVERLRVLGPPHATAALPDKPSRPMATNLAQAHATRRIDAFLHSLAADLGTSLRYSQIEAASLLDAALERFIEERFQPVRTKLATVQ